MTFQNYCSFLILQNYYTLCPLKPKATNEILGHIFSSSCADKEIKGSRDSNVLFESIMNIFLKYWGFILKAFIKGGKEEGKGGERG